MHISSHSQLNLGDALWPKINNNFKTLCIYATNATRSGHRSTQSQLPLSPPPSPLWNTLPAPFCHGSIVINHFRAPRCRRMTHASGQHWVLGLGLGPGLRYEPVRPLASRSGSSRCHQPCSYCSSPAPTSRVVCTFWRSQIVLLPVDSTNWKVFTSSRRHVARAAANSRPSHRSWPQSPLPLPLPVAVSLCRCPQPFNNKNFEQKFRGGVF